MIHFFLKSRFYLSAIIISLVIIFFHISLTAAAEFEKPIITRVQNLLRTRVETSGTGFIQIGNERIHAHQALPDFYEKRGFMPAWTGENGPLPFAADLLAALQAVSSDGLRAEYYHLEKIRSYYQTVAQPALNPGLNIKGLADLDLLLTDAFLVCGAHMVKGRINPESIDPEWFANLREINMPLFLEQALTDQQISEALFSLRPNHKAYFLLVAALEKYRMIAGQGGWQPVSSGASIKPGESSPRIPAVRKRLILTNDLTDEPFLSDELYDDQLKDVVIHFQQRHGIDTDGIIGPETLSNLNIGVDRRIDQLLLNLERWRWLPQNLGQTHILVNIANFSLVVREYDTTLIEMRAIVGKPYRRTPVFSDKVTYLVINPSRLI